MYLLNHPNNSTSLKLLRDEVASMKHQTLNSDLFKSKMKFGDACINEAMRMVTIIGAVPYHVKKGKTVQIKKKELKGPLTLLFAHSHWYDDPNVFDQPKTFMPRRWLAGDDHELSNFARSVFKPFGDGRHICLGTNIARLIMKANIYCFASEPGRSILYDFDKVTVVDSIFSEKKVSDNFLGRVTTAAVAS